MAADPVDVLVIGGGITGAGIARDAALRGFPKGEGARVRGAGGGRGGGAGAGGSRAAGGGALLRRAARRRPPRPRHHARRRTVRRADRELRGSHGALEAGWAHRRGDGAGRAEPPDPARAGPGCPESEDRKSPRLNSRHSPKSHNAFSLQKKKSKVIGAIGILR